MGDENSKHSGRQQRGTALTAESLQAKQSVRATFKLSDQIIDLLGIVAAQLGLKQKTLFDQLVEDVRVLDQVAAQTKGYTPSKEERRQKTFVISRKSLSSLEHVAREQHIPRDVLVELSIKRLLPVMNAEQQRHDKRKMIYADFVAYFNEGKALLKKAEKLLGEDDQALEGLRKTVESAGKNVAEIGELLERGKRMEAL